MSDLYLDRAVAPNLFDVAADPELVFPLVLANLMSPRLWRLREHLAPLPDPVRGLGEGSIRHFQEYIDHHFEHVASDRIAETNGVLDLDAEAERLGAAVVDYAVSSLQSAFPAR